MSRLHLLRFVDRPSVLHRAGARSKVLVLIGLVFALSFNPGWPSVGIVWATVVVGIVIGRLGFGVVPRPPNALLLAIGFSLVFGLLSGGEPFVQFGSSEIGLGGILLQLRLFGLTLGLLGLTLLMGWTTRAADLPVAASWIMKPLRAVGIPTGEVVAALTLAVRALPLVADEFATVARMARSEPPGRSPIDKGMAVVSTATVATVRRATEFGQSIEARGPIVVNEQSPRWNVSDAVVLVAGMALVAAVALAPGP